MELCQHLCTQGAMMPSTPIQTFLRHKLQGLVMQDPHSVVNSIIPGAEHLFPRAGRGQTRSEQWGSHGFTVERGLYPGWQEGPRQGTVLPRCGLSDDGDRTAMARGSRDSCSEQASEGDRTKAGAQERSNSEQSDQIKQGKHFQESHSQTTFLKRREKKRSQFNPLQQ